MIHTGKRAVTTVLLTVAVPGVLFLLFPSETRAAAQTSLRLCGEKLIPALFPFLVLTALYRRISPAPPRKPLLTVPLVGMLAGAPVGAELVGGLYRSGAIGRRTASSLLFLADTPSPAFLVLAVGEGMLGNRGLGWKLFFADTLAAFLIGGALLLTGGKPEKKAPAAPPGGDDPPRGPEAPPDLRLLPAISASVTDAALAMLRISGAVVFFGTVSGLPLPSATGKALLAAFTELTGGCAACAALGGETGLLLTAAAVGFSGLSVAAQVGFSANGVPMGRYFLGKALSALLTPMIFAIFLHFPR
ncbi:MAG: hypothetical protein MJ070_03295 [Lachnospiraceae bacterium]|nr:hypothetical protein [Lachnospiraceae bacterium]